MLIPLEKLYRQNTGDSLAISLAAFSEPAERIRFLADQLENMTGIQNFGAYLTAMLEIDAFFLNEDRHTNNIAVLYDTETEQYSLSPLFDQGLCLFADTSNDYPLDLPMDVCMERIEAKPFSSDFDTQLDAAEELYGIQLHFSFTTKDVCTELALSLIHIFIPFFYHGVVNGFEYLFYLNLRLCFYFKILCVT